MGSPHGAHGAHGAHRGIWCGDKIVAVKVAVAGDLLGGAIKVAITGDPLGGAIKVAVALVRIYRDTSLLLPCLKGHRVVDFHRQLLGKCMAVLRSSTR